MNRLAMVVCCVLTGCAAQVASEPVTEEQAGVLTGLPALATLLPPECTWCVLPDINMGMCNGSDAEGYECVAPDNTFWLLYHDGSRVHRALSLADEPCGASTMCAIAPDGTKKQTTPVFVQRQCCFNVGSPPPARDHESK